MDPISCGCIYDAGWTSYLNPARRSPPVLHALLSASTMLTRSLVAVLCGSLAVASGTGGKQYYPYEEYADHAAGEQWIARLDKPHPGSPRFPPPPGPPHEPPHEPPHPPVPPRDPHSGPHHPKVDDKTIFEALEADHR